MRLPVPRGPITATLFPHLTRPPAEHDLVAALRAAPPPSAVLGDALPGDGLLGDALPGDGVLGDDDFQLALFACYELHYQGFDDVDDQWEWEPSLLAARALLEHRFEQALARAVPRPPLDGPPLDGPPLDGPPLDGPPLDGPPLDGPHRVRRALNELVAADDGPSLSGYLARRADRRQFEEFVIHRSIYHLKEADPHTWAIPRLAGGPKAALVEIQSDEYGGGRRERMHSELFRATLRGLGLDDSYGAYLDRVPGVTLAISNVMSLFGLHRRLRGALVGHLAALEMTSSLPNRRYGDALRRLGGDADAVRFYDEHVQADAVHEQIAAHDLCGVFAAAHPSAAGDVLYGAACALELERRWAGHVLARWEQGATSLAGPADDRPAEPARDQPEIGLRSPASRDRPESGPRPPASRDRPTIGPGSPASRDDEVASQSAGRR